jgi:hypothetical protein
MKKHLLNDNFFDIFKMYYPDCIMTPLRIKNVIKKYVYNLDPNTTSSINLFNDETIDVQKTINTLSCKFENMYIVNVNTTDKVKMKDWTNLLEMSNKRSCIQTFINFIKYITFYLFMKRNNYKCYDVKPFLNSNIRMWINNINDNNVIDIVILDDKTINKIINDTTTNDLFKNTSCIYLEIKGFTNYSDFFDLLTINCFNTYSNINEITRQFGTILDMFPEKNFNVTASNISTIIIPFVLHYYHERINKISVMNPVFYPYSYHILFKSILDKKISVSTNYLTMINKLSLLDIFFNENSNDKQHNRLYDKNVSIYFDEDADLYSNKELLSIMLDMYSRVNLEKIEFKKE